MVPLPQILSSNNLIATHIPPSTVSVFVGGTTGIGAATIKALAKHAITPIIYIVGRSEASAENVIAVCRTLNPKGHYEFVKADLGTMKGTAAMCEDVKRKLGDKKINNLFLTVMSFSSDTTPDNLPTITSYSYYTRMLTIHRLLPHLSTSTPSPRIITIAAGALEGALSPSNLPAHNLPLPANRSFLRGHLSTLTSLALEAYATKTPQGKDITFIQSFPGTVPTELFQRIPGVLGYVYRVLIWVMGVLGRTVGVEESGERNAWLLSSARFPAASGGGGEGGSGVPVEGGVGVARGTDGRVGSGVYSLEWDGTAAGERSLGVLRGYRGEGMVERVWEDLQETWERTTR